MTGTGIHISSLGDHVEVTVGYLGSNGQRNEAKSIETLEFLSKVCGLMGSGDVDPLIKLLVTDQDLDTIDKVERKVAKVWLQSLLDGGRWEFGVEFDNGEVSSWSSWDMTKTATNFVQTMVNIKTGKTCNQFLNMADRSVWASVAGLLVPSS